MKRILKGGESVTYQQSLLLNLAKKLQKRIGRKLKIKRIWNL